MYRFASDGTPLAKQAARLRRRILAQKPNASAWRSLSALYRECGEHRLAHDALMRALAVGGESPEIHWECARVLRDLGESGQAIAHCESALQFRPALPEVLQLLGELHEKLGRPEEAARHFQRQVELTPREASAHSRLANSYRRLGRMKDALVHFRRAVELAPDDAACHANLGQMLLALDRAEEAIPSCQAAATLQPQSALLQLILADALRCAERFVEARTAYLDAIRLEPALAQAHANLGLLFRAQHKTHEAFAPLQQAVALEPRNGSYWMYLAETHGEWEDFPEAVRCWNRALALDPNAPRVHLGIAAALQALGHFAEAEGHIHTAMQLQPCTVQAHVAQARLLEQTGESARAESAFRAALDLQPACTPAQVGLADLLRGRLSQNDLAAIERRLENPGLSASSRTNLLFALANVLDARADYPSAAGRARQANECAALESRRRGGYSQEAHRRFVEGIKQWFDADFFRRNAGGGLTTARPVFVVGLPRSGTTLVEQILASHPHVYGAGELRLAWQSLMAVPAAVGRSDEPLLCTPSLHREALQHLARQHLNRLATLDGGRHPRIVDKMPDNYLYLGLLAVLFPNATFIHCRRDPRDVAVSCWFANFRWLDWANEFQHIAARIGEHDRLMHHWRNVLPVRLHSVAYEGLVNDVEKTARELVAACGLDWHPACLKFHETRRPVRTLSAAQVRRPIYHHSVARWRHYETELAELFALVAGNSNRAD